MDCKFEAARGKCLGVEDFKSLWDVMGGGVIKDTRYKPASLPAGVPRIVFCPIVVAPPAQSSNNLANLFPPPEMSRP